MEVVRVGRLGIIALILASLSGVNWAERNERSEVWSELSGAKWTVNKELHSVQIDRHAAFNIIPIDLNTRWPELTKLMERSELKSLISYWQS